MGANQDTQRQSQRNKIIITTGPQNIPIIAHITRSPASRSNSFVQCQIEYPIPIANQSNISTIINIRQVLAISKISVFSVTTSRTNPSTSRDILE
jgi:hypothetical protein